MKLIALGMAGFLLAGEGVAHADTFYLNYEAPKVENTTAIFSVVGVETFDTLSTGVQSFTTNFGASGAIAGTYSNVQINSYDQYGGAGGVGKYPVAFSSTPYTITLTASPTLDPQGINYFGYWLSALDAGNDVTFYKGATQVGSLSAASVLAALSTNPAYFGNPDDSGANGSQPYAFINFYDETGTFDKIAFTESPADGGYESDNHTVGFFTAVGGVPEPTSWALMLVGFGLAGGALRRRHKVTLAA